MNHIIWCTKNNGFHLDDEGDTACEEEDDQNHNNVMEKYSCEDDGPDIGGNESIDGPSESGIREHARTAVNLNNSKVRAQSCGSRIPG